MNLCHLQMYYNQKMLTLKKYILQFSVALLLAANFNVAFADELNPGVLLKDIKNYQCPSVNKNLSQDLITLSNSNYLIHEICSSNPVPKTCLSGVFSLKNEAIGLANIAKKPNSKACPMADEDKAQLIWYLTNYLNFSSQD